MTWPEIYDAIAWGSIHHPFLQCVRRHESDRSGPAPFVGGWRAKNPGSTASGAYQFLDSTWRNVWLKVAGMAPPTAHARDASPKDQSFLAGLLVIRGQRYHWAGSGC